MPIGTICQVLGELLGDSEHGQGRATYGWSAIGSAGVERSALARGQLTHTRLLGELGQALGVLADIARIPDPQDVARVLHGQLAAVGREDEPLDRAVEGMV